MSAFTDPDAVSRYAQAPVRLVPGFLDMQRMTNLLLSEKLGRDARLLVLGAGGGLELKLFAEAHPDWSFVGVDPSAEMLDLAKEMVGAQASRMQFHQGYIDSAPDGPFDGATCLLTLHFVPRDKRVATLKELRKRLKPGAPLVVAHHSIPRKEKELWLSRYAAFAVLNGVPAEQAENATRAISQKLPVMSPEQDEAALRDAGFEDVSLFYAGFSFRGWIAVAP